MRIDIGQLEFIDSNLREILTEIETLTGYEFTITSLYRMNDSGVHGTLPLRGADLRTRNAIVGKSIEQLINSRWKYSTTSDRTCAFLHGSGYNLHIHVQVHPTTVKLD